MIFGKGKLDVHAIDAGNERQGQHDNGDDGEDAHDLVDAIAGEGISGFGKAVDDLIVFIDDIAQFEEVIGDITEVFFHLIVQNRVLDGFQLLHDGDLLADDAAQRDDIAAQQSDLLDDTLGVGCEELVFDGVDAPVHLAQYGKDVIHQLVDERVEGVVGAATQQALTLGAVGLAAFDQVHQRFERAVMHGDHEFAADEEIDFGGARDLVSGIPEWEVHDHEYVGIVLVELGPFDRAADVLEVERVEVGKALAEICDVGCAGVRQVEPGEVAMADDSRGHGDNLTTEGSEDTDVFSPQRHKGHKGRSLLVGGIVAEGKLSEVFDISTPSKSPPMHWGRLGRRWRG